MCNTLQIGIVRNTSLNRVPAFEWNLFGKVKYKPMLNLGGKKSKSKSKGHPEDLIILSQICSTDIKELYIFL